MSVASGQMLSHYRVTEKIGEGGMGVVWRAEDTVLKRDVALKFLPDGFATDAERLARFEREARFLASLNHPNIAAIHGLEEADGERFLVLELVPGTSLAERVNKRSLPVEETLKVCSEIARALETAHEKGVIHRDLKPGNVQLTSEGQIKVLDFGLAKAFDEATEPGDESQRVTVSNGTNQQTIVGTTPYMSPEQASAKPLDKRTDIWSFGCILYELLIGQRAFAGDTVFSTIAAIHAQDPDWERLPAETPVRIRELLRLCLAKDPDSRLHDIADARIQIEDALAGREWTDRTRIAEVSTGTRRPWRSVALTAGATLVGIAVGAGLLMRFFPPSTHVASVPPVTRLSIATPGSSEGNFFLSPDGSTVVYSVREQTKGSEPAVDRLYTRRLDRYEVVPVQGSDGYINAPEFSPDGRWLAFLVPVEPQSSKIRLMKVPLDGSAPPQVVSDWGDWSTVFVWLPDGDIVTTNIVETGKQALMSIPTDGSAPKVPVEIDADYSIPTYVMSVLPDGHNVLTNVGNSNPWHMGLLDVETGEARLLMEDAVLPRWASTGHILFGRRDTLFAVPFDLDGLEITGAPVAIMDGIRVSWGQEIGKFEHSIGGTLIYRPGRLNVMKRLVIVDRDGNVEPWSDDRNRFGAVRISRDGQSVAVAVGIPGEREVWVSELDRPRLRPVASGRKPAWSPDGEYLAIPTDFSSPNQGVYLHRSDGIGEPELLLESAKIGTGWNLHHPESFSPDGSALLMTRQAGKLWEVLLLPMEPDSLGIRTPKTLLTGSSVRPAPRYAPDGRMFAYGSNSTGRQGVYVRQLREDGSLGPEIVVALGNVRDPIWSKRSNQAPLELFYLSAPDRMMGVSIMTEPTLVISEPRQALDLGELRLEVGDVLPDGRFLAVQSEEEEGGEAPRINVVQNFYEELKRKLAAAH